MSELALHPLTQQQLEQYAAAPTHAVMLVGAAGSGKRSLARHITMQVLAAKSVDEHPYVFKMVAEPGKAISIDEVRKLEQFLKRKVPGAAAYNRAVIIEDAQLLGDEAQNALLKTLEEPPVGTILVLTVNRLQSLLPTIRSRTQTITVQPPDKDRLQAAFADSDSAAFQKAYAISGGLPGLMYALLNEAEHPLLEATQRARTLLGQSTYERLLSVDELSKQKQLAADITFIMQQMAQVSLRTAQGPAARQWQTILKASYEANEAMASNAQSKLVMTQLMLSL